MEHSERSNQAIGQRLSITRQALGLKQKQFAERAGLTPSAYNQYETGLYKPSVDAANALCDRYFITLDWIFRGSLSGVPYDLAEAIRSIRELREKG